MDQIQGMRHEEPQIFVGQFAKPILLLPVPCVQPSPTRETRSRTVGRRGQASENQSSLVRPPRLSNSYPPSENVDEASNATLRAVGSSAEGRGWTIKGNRQCRTSMRVATGSQQFFLSTPGRAPVAGRSSPPAEPGNGRVGATQPAEPSTALLSSSSERSGSLISGAPGKPPAYAGTDFIVARNGRIAPVNPEMVV